jgi:hypothetical protein
MKKQRKTIIRSYTIEGTKTNQRICSSTIERTKTKQNIHSSTISYLTLLILSALILFIFLKNLEREHPSMRRAYILFLVKYGSKLSTHLLIDANETTSSKTCEAENVSHVFGNNHCPPENL